MAVGQQGVGAHDSGAGQLPDQLPDQPVRRRHERARLAIVREGARAREGLGRSRGGLTSKIHAAGRLDCRLLVAVVSPGQRADSRGLTPVMQRLRLRLPRRGPGRPRTRPDRVLGDKAYSTHAIRTHLRRNGIRATIPVKDDQAVARRARGCAGGRPPAFDADAYAYTDRNTIERGLGRLKHHRAVALRSDKRLFIFAGTVNVATIDIRLRDLTRDPPDTAQQRDRHTGTPAMSNEADVRR